jgi:hypothetical protein
MKLSFSMNKRDIKLEPNYIKLDRTQKSKHDLVEIFICILDVLRVNNNLSTSDFAMVMYNHNTASRLTVYMTKLYCNGLVTRKNLSNIKNTPSTRWSIREFF